MTNRDKTKSYEISKREVYSAWLRVRKKGGGAGVDGVNIADFEINLSKNLYKMWNRMSSGSYFPQAVKRVEIPKPDGGKRPLGIPTIYDRVAQEVVRARLEPMIEPCFVQDSYGFRPEKSAQDAVQKCRSRNFRYDWAIDLDISKYFDTIDHELLMKAVEHHCSCKWMLLYITRWLKAPIKNAEGEEWSNATGTPQGGVISPLLSNLYLHYVFDTWFKRQKWSAEFERFADDIVVHCESRDVAEEILNRIIERFAECNLSVNTNKTRLVYCKDEYRREEVDVAKNFDFLGFTFRARRLTQKSGKIISRFLPSASRKAKKKLRKRVKRIINNKNHRLSLAELNKILTPIIRGWHNYFKTFSTANDFSDIWWYLQRKISVWLKRKYQKNISKVGKWMQRIRKIDPRLLIHWQLAYNYDWTRRAV